jgi:hypothetical protein
MRAPWAFRSEYALERIPGQPFDDAILQHAPLVAPLSQGPDPSRRIEAALASQSYQHRRWPHLDVQRRAAAEC